MVDLLRSCENDRERVLVLNIQTAVADGLRKWAVENMMKYPVRFVTVKGDGIEMTMLETDAVYRLTMEKVR